MPLAAVIAFRLFLIAAPASADQLALSEARLTIELAAGSIVLPATAVNDDPGVMVMVSSGTGGFALSASIVRITSVVPKQLLTGVPLISTLNVTMANGPLTLSQGGGGPGGGFGGTGGLQGRMIFDVLGGLIPLSIPLSAVGDPPATPDPLGGAPPR